MTVDPQIKVHRDVPRGVPIKDLYITEIFPSLGEVSLMITIVMWGRFHGNWIPYPLVVVVELTVGDF